MALHGVDDVVVEADEYKQQMAYFAVEVDEV